MHVHDDKAKLQDYFDAFYTNYFDVHTLNREVSWFRSSGGTSSFPTSSTVTSVVTLRIDASVLVAGGVRVLLRVALVSIAVVVVNMNARVLHETQSSVSHGYRSHISARLYTCRYHDKMPQLHVVSRSI